MRPKRGTPEVEKIQYLKKTLLMFVKICWFFFIKPPTLNHMTDKEEEEKILFT